MSPRTEDQGAIADWTPIERVACHLTVKLLDEYEELSRDEIEEALYEIGGILETGELTAEHERLVADAFGEPDEEAMTLDRVKAGLESALEALDGVTS